MITNAHYAIDGTAVKIVPTGIGHRTAHIAALGNTTVYLGGSNAVTSINGFAYTKALGETDFILGPLDELWAICENLQTETLTVMVVQ